MFYVDSIDPSDDTFTHESTISPDDNITLKPKRNLIVTALSRVLGNVLIISPRSRSEDSSMDHLTSTRTNASVLTPDSEDISFENLKQTSSYQINFLKLNLPDIIFNHVTNECQATGFPKEAPGKTDDSRLLKDNSYFLICKMNFVPNNNGDSIILSNSGKNNEETFDNIANQPIHTKELTFSQLSSAKFAFNNGINVATLQNVCLSENKNEIILLKQFSTDRILSSDLRNILQKTSSGFYPFGNKAGWRFSEVTSDEFSKYYIKNKSDFLYFTGMTAISSPAYAPQMIHTMQTLFPLLEASMHPSLYPWINELER